MSAADQETVTASASEPTATTPAAPAAQAAAAPLPEDIHSQELTQEQAYEPGKDINEVIPPPTYDPQSGVGYEYMVRVKLGENKKDDESDKLISKDYHRPQKGMYFTRGKNALVEFQALVARGMSEDQARGEVAKATNDRGGKQYPLMGIVTVEHVIESEGDFYHIPLGRDWPNTMINRSGTSSFADLMNKAGHTLPRGLSLQDQAQYADHWLGSHSTGELDERGAAIVEEGIVAPARLIWSGYCTTEEQEIKALKGEKNWPPRYDQNGEVVGHYACSTVETLEEVDPETGLNRKKRVTVECPSCGSEIRARASVGQFLLSV